MERLRRRSVATVAAVAIMLGTAGTCRQLQHRTPEGLIAEYGGKIARTVAVAQEKVGDVGRATQTQAVRDGAIAALKGLELVNQKGLQLATALDVISKARAAGGAVSPQTLAEALALVDAIDTDLLTAVVPQLGSPEAKAGLDAVRAVGKLVLNIQLELGKASAQ